MCLSGTSYDVCLVTVRSQEENVEKYLSGKNINRPTLDLQLVVCAILFFLEINNSSQCEYKPRSLSRLLTC